MKKTERKDLDYIDFIEIQNFFFKNKKIFILTTLIASVIGIVSSSKIENKWVGNSEIIFRRNIISKDEIHNKTSKNINVNKEIFKKKKIFENASTAYEIMNNDKFKYDLFINSQELHKINSNEDLYNQFKKWKAGINISQLRQNIIKLSIKNKNPKIIPPLINNALSTYKEIYKKNSDKQINTNLKKNLEEIINYKLKIRTSYKTINKFLFNENSMKKQLSQIDTLFDENKLQNLIKFKRNFSKVSIENQDKIISEIRNLKIYNQILNNLLYEYNIKSIKKDLNIEPWIYVKEPILFEEDNSKKKLSYLILIIFLINLISTFILIIKQKISN